MSTAPSSVSPSLGAPPDPRLAALFPTSAEVPAAMTWPATQPRILIAGEVRVYSKRTRDVVSPLWLRDSSDREPTATVLGQTAHVSTDDALEALAAARQAWAQGAGHWPTLRVEERIEAVEHFTAAMVAVRDRV